nr:YihY/virulence factor BrkB family protein [Chlamydia ibidis]
MCNETSKEACVISYYGLFSCIPILMFFLRLSQHLFSNLDFKEWLLLKFPDYKEPILAIVDTAYHSTASSIGLVLLGSFFVFCWAGILMLLSLEDGLNKIFRVGHTSISIQRLIAYLVITLISPMVFIIFCGSWIYITQIMPTQYSRIFSLNYSMTILYVISQMLPYFLIYLTLFCCYAFLPRVSVQKKFALISALIIGSVWVVFQRLFFILQFHLFNYSFTYGALVALPSFLLLLYCYAIIYLFGGAFTFLMQNQGFHFEYAGKKPLPDSYFKATICIYLLSVILKNFDKALPSPTEQSLAKDSKIPIGEISQSLNILEKEGLIITHNNNLKPAFNISNLTIQQVLDKLFNLSELLHADHNATIRNIQERLKHVFHEGTQSSYNMTLSELSKKLK